ncbi:Hypothetical_protein [Hexamita inflata]|uniref:Hypothetical_protein n=1 Tax=Hexamita inflata TaxID=28002 RepID=A0AA86TVA7_9EUKA|nr:Hypothetical protein HINF_LOCUS16112 [Hexamita inflata]CAI9957013.1 Hypothetical protein HINF_LOCUS44658 [Hexamita inflata]
MLLWFIQDWQKRVSGRSDQYLHSEPVLIIFYIFTFVCCLWNNQLNAFLSMLQNNSKINYELFFLFFILIITLLYASEKYEERIQFCGIYNLYFSTNSRGVGANTVFQNLPVVLPVSLLLGNVKPYYRLQNLNIWKIEILILKYNYFTQQFQKYKRISKEVMMLSCTIAPVHNDMKDLDCYRMLLNNISINDQNNFTVKSVVFVIG